MRLKNKITKVILETNSTFVIEQLMKSGDYEEVKEVKEIKEEVVKPLPKKNKNIDKD